MSLGQLICIPTPIGESLCATEVLPASTIARISVVHDFVAENARNARRFLRSIDAERDLQETRIVELNQHTVGADLPAMLAPLLAGRDLGLLSDAGCPGIADPGADLISLAQDRGVRVVPLIGPSSLVLALMASGLNGQRFAFVGYVASDRTHREQELRALEQRSARNSETILMIETPYRAAALLQSMVATLSANTRLCVAYEIGEPGESVVTRPIAKWRARSGDLPKGRAVFLMLAETQRTTGTSRPVRSQRPSE